MPAPKRRAGETQEEFNRRRIAYYANRRALNDAFYDDEEDVDIRDLTAGSPNSNGAVVSDMDINGDEDWDNFVKSNAKKPSRLRNPANSNRFYAEDRRQSSRRPSGDRNIWEGLDIPSEYVYDDFTVDDSWVRGNADTAESSRRNPAMKAFRGRVLEENDQNVSAKMKGITKERVDNTKGKRFSGTRGEKASTSVTNNTLQEGKTKTVREGTVSVAKNNPRQALEDGFRRDRADNYGGRFKGIAGNASTNRAALTPGDYTRNIGNRNEPSEPWNVDTGPNRRPRRVAEGGEGIRGAGTSVAGSGGSANNRTTQRDSASRSSMSGNFRGISETGKTNTQIGQTKRFDEPIATNRNQASKTKTVRDGTMARMGSSRQMLKNGFNEEKKKSQFKGRHN